MSIPSADGTDKNIDYKADKAVKQYEVVREAMARIYEHEQFLWTAWVVTLMAVPEDEAA